MNFILTSLWLFGMTWLGYWVGDSLVGNSGIVLAIVFFVIALILRLALGASGKGSGGSYDGGSSDDGFFSFFGGIGSDSGGWGGDCGGGDGGGGCD